MTARWCSISASSAATSPMRRRIRWKPGTGCGSPAATACVPTCGSGSRAASRFPKFSNFTPQPKEICRSTTRSKSPAPSAACRPSWRTDSPPRSSNRTSQAASRCATRKVIASLAPMMRSARRSAGSKAPAAASTAIPTRGSRKRRSCVTYSRPATPGFAPATSCARISRAISISSTASAIPSAGKVRM